MPCRIIAILLLVPSILCAQSLDDSHLSLAESTESAEKIVSASSKYVWQMPVPCAAVGLSLAFGAATHWVDPLERVNPLVREEIFKLRHYHNADRYYTFDNYTQYIPLASVLALRLCGVQSQHNAIQLTCRVSVGWGLSYAVNYPLKQNTNVLRPNRGGAYNSFPSGHTTTAFLGAEMLRLEYSHIPIIPIIGYSVASFTGFMRIYNDYHWLGDVLAGAAIGIIFADLSYFLCHEAEKLFSPQPKHIPLSQCQISVL